MITADAVADYKPYPIKVLQFGGGVFLRGYCDWMIQQMNKQSLFNGAVAMVKLTGRGDLSAYDKQGGVFQHIIRGVEHAAVVNKHEVVTCIQKWVHPYQAWQDYLALASEPGIEVVVSNSTEAGIRYEACDKPEESCPNSFPAKLCMWLFKRFSASLPGLWILPFELVADNGDQLRDLVKRHAEDWMLDEAFHSWLDAECHFVNTLVDRIVAAPSSEEAAALCTAGGLQEDVLLNASEPYHVLVLDADESLEEVFPLAKAGLNVVYTDSLDQYRERKVKILNGAHTSMLFLSYLLGNTTVEDSMNDERIVNFLQTVLSQEVIPTIDMPVDELTGYVDSVVERFKNPFLKHQLLSISLNSISKIQHRVLRTLREYAEKNNSLPVHLCLSFASFLHFYHGTWQADAYVGQRDDELYTIQDDLDGLRMIADFWSAVDAGTPLADALPALLELSQLWGSDLCSIPGFEKQVLADLNCLREEGVEACLAGLASIN